MFNKVVPTTRTRRTADPNNLQRGRARKDVRLNSFSIRVIDKWNSIPDEIKSLRTPASLKTYLKRN